MRLDMFIECLMRLKNTNGLEHEGQALKMMLEISDCLPGEDWEVQSLHDTAEAVLRELREGYVVQ